MAEFPFVSVVMPVRNEATFIARSLGAVLTQDYPHERLEVLIADGKSRDGTVDAIARLAAAHPDFQVTVVDNPSGIVATGLNRVVRQARGEVIIRVDGHTIIAPDYVRECVKALQLSGADNAGGRMDPVSNGGFGEAVALATSSPFGVGGARFHYSTSEEWVDTVYMGAWPREVFDHIGLFDEELVRNQDDEFNYRLLSQGGRILLSPRIKSLYYNRSTLRSLWRQYFQYGYWKVRVMQKHPRQMRLRQFAPGVLVTVLLIFGLLALFSTSMARLWFAILVVYALANLTASVSAVGKSNWRRLPSLALAFMSLHFSYGLGFLTGLLKFWKRWGNKETKPPLFSAARPSR